MFPKDFSNVKVLTKANIYFDGKVISHTVLFQDGTKKTLGLIYPCAVFFGTDAAERMEIVSGSCRVKLKGSNDWKDYSAEQSFDVPAKSGFDIEVRGGICEYICSFLK
jgi:uncharacterized protein YaiE (UPF0345 family)